MKKLIFIHGPNGVGKSSLCKALHVRLENSAWVESEWCRCINPFIFNEEVELLTEKNMTQLIRSYLECSFIEYVILDWGLHGPRGKILKNVLENLRDLDYLYIPVTIKCSEDENIRRMLGDGRDSDRVERALKVRCIYEELPYPCIDTTDMTVDLAADEAIKIINGM